MPEVTILILNWNGLNLLPRCLQAVHSQIFMDYETLVVDNASTDGSADELETRWPGVRVIRSPRNLGFAAGNNLGASQAQGAWLALLNNDAFPEPDWLQALVCAARDNPGYNFFASQILQDSRPHQIDATGDVLHISGNAWHRDLNLPLEQAHNQPEEVFSACAAAAMYERRSFLAAGGFEESFFSHHEDVDLGFRLRIQGGRCLYVPGARVYHTGSASFGKESNFSIAQVHRNLVWSYAANMPNGLAWKYLPAHLFASLVFLAYYTRRGQGLPYLRAKAQALAGLPAALRRRRQVQGSRKIHTAEIDRLLNHDPLGPFLLGSSAGRLRNLFRR